MGPPFYGKVREESQRRKRKRGEELRNQDFCDSVNPGVASLRWSRITKHSLEY